MASLFDPGDLGALGAFVSVVIIDVVLAGDNAIVVGLAASGLEPKYRRRVILGGILAATVLRIALALIAVRLLAVIGLTLAGGILLLWVAWKFYRELVARNATPRAKGAQANRFAAALVRVVIADLSMSLDNVLAVAGTAHDHVWVLAGGLVLSVALMGAASELMARLLDRHRWIAWIGLAIVTFVAVRMIYEGSTEVATRLSLAAGLSKNWVL
jgi:YjbE family integral membrane protein